VAVEAAGAFFALILLTGGIAASATGSSEGRPGT